MSKNIVFETRNLSKSYGRVTAIKDLSVSVEEGQIYGILGPNGSGKTTTLSIATGIIEADKGEFKWFNQKPEPQVRKKIGSLIEIPHFYPYLNLIDNLVIIARIKGYGLNDIERVLRVVKLYDRRKSKFRTLSLGMKQRLGIASTLLGDPGILVLDEPTNGLDPEGIAEVRELIISEAKKGKTIIMASHILSEVEKVCTHVAILKSGSLIEQGNVKTIISGEKLVEVNATDKQKLKKILEECKFVSSLKDNNGNYLITLTDEKNASDLNTYVYKKGLVLNELINHKKSLESQFLELVKNKE